MHDIMQGVAVWWGVTLGAGLLRFGEWYKIGAIGNRRSWQVTRGGRRRGFRNYLSGEGLNYILSLPPRTWISAGEIGLDAFQEGGL